MQAGRFLTLNTMSTSSTLKRKLGGTSEFVFLSKTTIHSSIFKQQLASLRKWVTFKRLCARYLAIVNNFVRMIKGRSTVKCA